MKLPPDLEADCLRLADRINGRPAGVPQVAPGQSEKEFMAEVRAIAKRAGWRCYHTFSSKKSEAGWPDLVLCRAGRILFRELKTEEGQTTADQDSWLECLKDAGQDACVWRPSDWPAIVATLESKP